MTSNNKFIFENFLTVVYTSKEHDKTMEMIISCDESIMKLSTDMIIGCEEFDNEKLVLSISYYGDIATFESRLDSIHGDLCGFVKDVITDESLIRLAA